MNIIHTLPHRLHRLLTGITPDVLNKGTVTEHAGDLLHTLKQYLNQISAIAYNTELETVDYTILKNSDLYADYRQLTNNLREFDLNELPTREEKLEFWINLYNILTIDTVLHYGIKADINEVNGVFYRAGYNIGGMFFSLYDIEQGILRANIGHPAVIGTQFASQDPRIQYVMSELDPRIHFALVCAAESCPPINLYTAAAIDEQLDLATQSFINSSAVQIDVDTKTANVSKIFQWYAPDFGASFAVTLGFGDATPILRWIAPHIKNEDTQYALIQNISSYSVTFQQYDWSLNTK